MEFLQKTAEEMGIVPKALLTAPTLEPHLAYYYDQYQELARSRAYTEGQPLPIPVSELLAHCQLHQLSVTDSEELREYVFMFDRIWLDVQYAKRAAAAKATS